VVTIAVASAPELYVDASSPALVELRVFIEAAVRHVRSSLEMLDHVRRQRHSSRGGGGMGSAHTRAMVLRLALTGVAESRLRKRSQQLLSWYHAVARVACTRLPKAREAEIVNEVQLTLMNASDVDELTENVMTTFQRLIHAERSTLYIYDWKRNTLTSCFAAGAKNFELKLTGTRLGVIGLAVVNDENILVEVAARGHVRTQTPAQRSCHPRIGLYSRAHMPRYAVGLLRPPQFQPVRRQGNRLPHSIDALPATTRW